MKRSIRLYLWLVRQDLRRGWGNRWISALAGVLPVIVGLEYGIQLALTVLFAQIAVSWCIGWYLWKHDAIPIEMEYVTRINPAFKRIDDNVRRNSKKSVGGAS